MYLLSTSLLFVIFFVFFSLSVTSTSLILAKVLHATNSKNIRAIAVGQEVKAIDTSFSVRGQDYLAVPYATIDESGSAEINTLQFSSDGKYVATGADNSKVVVMEAEDGKVISKAHTGAEMPIYAVSFAASGKNNNKSQDDDNNVEWKKRKHSLFVAGEDELIREFDFMNSMQRKGDTPSLRGHDSRIRGLASHPFDSDIIASGANEPADIFLWNVTDIELNAKNQEDIQPFLVLQGHDKPIKNVIFLPDGSQVCSSSYDGKICCWWTDFSSKNTEKRVLGEKVHDCITIHKSPVTALAVSKQGFLASGDFNGKLFLFQVRPEDGKKSVVIPAFSGVSDSNVVSSLSFTIDGSILVASTVASTKKPRTAPSVRFFDLTTMKQIGQNFYPHGDDAPVYNAIFSPTKMTQLVTASLDGRTIFWDVTFGKMLHNKDEYIAGVDDRSVEKLEWVKNEEKKDGGDDNLLRVTGNKGSVVEVVVGGGDNDNKKKNSDL